MRVLLLAALLGAACTRPKPPPPGGDTTVVDTVRPPVDTVTPPPPVDTAVTPPPPADSIPVDVDSTEAPPPDTTAVVVPESSITAVPAPSAGRCPGVPFGPFGGQIGGGGFTVVFTSTNPKTLPKQLALARATHTRLFLTMTGGEHPRDLTAGKFDIAKWRAVQDGFNTPALRAEVVRGVADCTIIGNSVMDEPMNTSKANSWGPKGTMTKSRVDAMCAYTRSQHPTLPTGVVHDDDDFEPAKSYRPATGCQFIVSQYRWNKSNPKGDATKFRDACLALAKRDGIVCLYSLNIRDGGEPKLPCAAGAGVPGDQGKPLCRMTAKNIREWGTILGSAGCALFMWKQEPAFMARADNQQAFKFVRDSLWKLPGCKRAA